MQILKLVTSKFGITTIGFLLIFGVWNIKGCQVKRVEARLDTANQNIGKFQAIIMRRNMIVEREKAKWEAVQSKARENFIRALNRPLPDGGTTHYTMNIWVDQVSQ